MEEEIFTALGQGNMDMTGETVHQMTCLAYNAAFNNAEEVEHGDLFHPGVGDGIEAEGGNVTGREHAVQCAVLIDHREGGNALIPHVAPSAIHGDGGAETGRTVKIQVLHLCADVIQHLGRLETEAAEHTVSLVADGAQMGGHIAVFPQCVFQRGIGHGCHDGVGIGVAVTGNIDGVHRQSLLFRCCCVHCEYIIILLPPQVNKRKNF